MLKNLCIFHCCDSSEFCLLALFILLVTAHSLAQGKCLCDHDVYILVSDGCTGGDMRLCVFHGSEVAAFVF